MVECVFAPTELGEAFNSACRSTLVKRYSGRPLYMNIHGRSLKPKLS
jgi:hypothetical protein